MNLSEIFEKLSVVYPNATDRLNVLIKMFTLSGYDQSNKVITSTNDNVTSSLIRIYCLAYIANTIPYITFDSSSQAMSIIQQIRPLFEAELSDTLKSGDTFGWLSRLLNKSIADISTRGSQLPQVNSFYCDLLPIPVVAQYLYQNGDRDSEIVLRNNSKIKHPLFYQGQLEVLSS